MALLAKTEDVKTICKDVVDAEMARIKETLADHDKSLEELRAKLGELSKINNANTDEISRVKMMKSSWVPIFAGPLPVSSTTAASSSSNQRLRSHGSGFAVFSEA